MSRVIDLRKTIFELAEEHADFVEIMKELGFSEITKSAMLHSVGKIMTLPRGAKMKDIPKEKIISVFNEKGFEVIGLENAEAAGAFAESSERADEATTLAARDAAAIGNASGRTELIKSYLRRLGEGETLEAVQADFVREFGEVEASEIMKAEQELMKEGTPLEEVQKLCDVHSALFHGSTREEKIMNAEKAVNESMAKSASDGHAAIHESAANNVENASRLESVTGHPLYTFTKENEKLADLISVIRAAIEKKGDVAELLTKVRELSIHYAKKGDLLYPHLSVKYGVTGPSQVMWTVDDEIRDELGALEKERDRGDWWFTRLGNVITRAEEMIYKEQNILFPICAASFTDEEWVGIYHDSKDYADCLGVTKEIWDEAEANLPKQTVSETSGEIVMPGGHMTLEQLTALLNTIPLEISFIDADNINRFFNEGPKVFKRPSMALDREVFSCHPPKIEPMVRSIIDDFRNNRRDSVPVWMDKNGRTFLVTYMAVRDNEKNYLGNVEIVQDMKFAKEHFGIE